MVVSVVVVQMMKALLECVISKNTEVHQASLLLVSTTTMPPHSHARATAGRPVSSALTKVQADRSCAQRA